MKRIICLSSWVIFLVACSAQISITEDDKQSEQVTKTPSKCLASHEDPFSCLAQACFTASGKYDPVSHTCDCPNLEHVFSPYNGGECLLADTFNESIPVSRISIDGEIAPKFSHKRFPIIQNNYFEMHILSNLKEESLKRLHENLLVTEITLFYYSESMGTSRYYLEPEPKRWPYLIQREDLSLSSELTLPNSPVVLKAWQKILDPMQEKNQHVEFFTQDGCAGHCIIEYRYPSFDNHRLLEMNEYVGGLSVRHQILIEEQGLPLYHARYAVIEVDPSRSPNLIYLTEKKPDPVSGDLIRNMKMYSRTGELLSSSENKVSLPRLRQELELRDSHKNSSDKSVVICDEGLLPSSVPLFRVGPRTDKSFWGWINPELEEQELGLREQLSGVDLLSKINGGYSDSFAKETHGASVGRVATQYTNFSIISMTSDQCFSHYKQWKKNVQPFAKIINVSAGFYYDQIACEQEPRFRDSIGDPEQPFLWILGAGNDSRANLTSENASYCPQTFHHLSNTLVVTADTAGYRNIGVEYADIAADGRGYYPGDNGTSFATPRVSRVAALLAKEFPSLSVREIRSAILLGARVPTPRLPVRSGGILDERGARAAARKIYEARK
ncbi:MAG: S8 family serine peptidase [Myxococcaceae bacterium]